MRRPGPPAEAVSSIPCHSCQCVECAHLAAAGPATRPRGRAWRARRRAAGTRNHRPYGDVLDNYGAPRSAVSLAAAAVCRELPRAFWWLGGAVVPFGAQLYLYRGRATMEGLEERLDAWAKGYLDAKRLPCLAVAVTQGNQVTLRKDYGSAAQPLTPGLGPEQEASYMMMSCTKVVTAVAALQLLEQGKWALEDPVSNYLPTFGSIPGVVSKQDSGRLEPVATPITMRMLLTHTSGTRDSGSAISSLRLRTNDSRMRAFRAELRYPSHANRRAP